VRLYHSGDRGEPVRDIQGRLLALGYDTAPDAQGSFGDSTERAVRQFQEARGLPRDGIVGPDTWQALVDAGFRLGDRLLYRRVPPLRGDDVAELQRRMNSLGFECGKVDGNFEADTLEAILDFQHNRGMAVDGIVGREVIDELQLMQRETDKPGRDAVRERQWLAALPNSIVGQRIYVDAACRDEEETAASWEAAVAASTIIQNLGGHPILSRSVDTAPPERLRARRANGLDVDIVLSFQISQDGDEAVYFFSSGHSRSEAGETIATAIARRLGIGVRGATIAMLRETRSPAVVIAVARPHAATGRLAATAIAELHSATHGDLPDSPDQPMNAR
jgi:N-acetylmuramoyl-L-alanine amidase